jgi:hypothetical protein
MELILQKSEDQCFITEYSPCKNDLSPNKLFRQDSFNESNDILRHEAITWK